ncbi:50S ribosome-binding GTPase [Vogesella sp. DC21W]|uniref:50S ribosome-binding GTPase n=1 Tax=Vogesella aquatica TaxID=2984206 RepID=A0ABT5IUN5_9NEIS|nr:GTPase [Vogesella aquatica]MDC7715985.1 50S ribosome-binding GTPase [Vogesella aquatica]
MQEPDFQPGQALAQFKQLIDRAELQLTSQQRQQILGVVNQVLNYHAVVGVMGKTGAGKSSLCNSLFGATVTEVSDVGACTRHPNEISLVAKGDRGLSLIDMPGVGESTQRDVDYKQLYQEWLPKLDCILWLIKADDRALSVDETFYRDVVLPALADKPIPILFVLSQADKVEPCREWNWQFQTPGFMQAANIRAKEALICQQFKLSPKSVCSISAEENYGLPGLLEKLVLALPAQKKWAMAREAKAEWVSAAAKQEAQDGLWSVVVGTVKAVAKEACDYVVDRITTLASRVFGWLW